MKVLVKMAVGLAVLAGFLYLFVRTARDARATPYTAQRQHLQPWRLSLESPASATAPLLTLRPPQEFAGSLFSQVFQRMMESLKGTTAAGVPVVLQGEYARALSGRYAPESLLDAARTAGLESSQLTPVCVAVRRISEPGITRQLYFVIFDAPAIVAFRQALAAGAGDVAFDPASLSPVMIIGGSDATFDSWLPIRADADADCLAPIVIE